MQAFIWSCVSGPLDSEQLFFLELPAAAEHNARRAVNQNGKVTDRTAKQWTALAVKPRKAY